jgi:hypothetical protein
MLDNYCWFPVPRQNVLKFKSGQTEVSDMKQIISHQSGMQQHDGEQWDICKHHPTVITGSVLPLHIPMFSTWPFKLQLNSGES